MINFSIIICTHDPRIGLLERLFNAIKLLDTDGLLIEVLVIDNNSTPELAEQKVVQDFIKSKPYYKLLQEFESGLTAARIKGITASQYDWLVFFDDDNEPASNYLSIIIEAIEQYPQTLAWGPAKIQVELIESSSSWLLSEKVLFQERNYTTTIINNQPNWQDYYPFGTGLIIKKDIALLYTKRIHQKRYTLTDRKGKTLASGGDVQLVLTAIEQGFYVGVIAGLKINHLIDKSKTSLNYLQKLEYGKASAYLKAFNQVFLQSSLPVESITNKRIIIMLYSLIRIHKPVTTKERFLLLLASRMGELNARAELTKNKKPFLLKLYEIIIHV